jgi:hypothetical protein
VATLRRGNGFQGPREIFLLSSNLRFFLPKRAFDLILCCSWDCSRLLFQEAGTNQPLQIRHHKEFIALNRSVGGHEGGELRCIKT